MTGLYVICATSPQHQLSMRRWGYQEHPCRTCMAYTREAGSPDMLGSREGEHVRMLPQWIEDISSVASDPHACFFYVELQHREAVGEAIERGLALPVTRSRLPMLSPDVERRSAQEWQSHLRG